MSQRFKGIGSGIRRRAFISGYEAYASSVTYGSVFADTGSGPPPPPPDFAALDITNSAGSGCVLWLRADSVTLSGNFVSVWVDKSTRGLNFTASELSRMAGYNATSSFKSMPAVEFNGTSHAYRGMTTMNLTGTSKLTMFIFGDMKFAKNGGTFAAMFDTSPRVSLPRNAAVLGWNTATTSNPNVFFIGTSMTSQPAPYEFATGSGVPHLPPTTPNSGVIITGKFDHHAGDGDKLQLTANYSPVTLKYGGLDVAGLGPYGNLVPSLGAWSDGVPSSFFSGAIMEVLVYDFQLTETQVSSVITYLSGRYL